MKLLFATLLTAWAFTSCSVHPPAHGSETAVLSDRHIYDEVRLGMTQSQVEKKVGKPHAPVSHGLAFYGGPPVPAWDPLGERSVPFNVVVLYSTNLVVRGKMLYKGPGPEAITDGDCSFGNP
jgi:hypothetical protein